MRTREARIPAPDPDDARDGTGADLAPLSPLIAEYLARRRAVLERLEEKLRQLRGSVVH